jgi:hypothetical protein
MTVGGPEYWLWAAMATVFGAVAAGIAARKGRSVFLGTLLGAVLGPLGVLAILLFEDHRRRPRAGVITTADLRRAELYAARRRVRDLQSELVALDKRHQAGELNERDYGRRRGQLEAQLLEAEEAAWAAASAVRG